MDITERLRGVANHEEQRRGMWFSASVVREGAREIDRLRAEVARLTALVERDGEMGDRTIAGIVAEHADEGARIAGLEAEVERLREALRPFAEEVDEWATSVPDDALVFSCADDGMECEECGAESDRLYQGHTLGDLRRARALLSREVARAD